MGKEPEVIAADIAATREGLSRDVEALADRVSPGRVLDRRVQGAKGRMSILKDKVMGSKDEVTGSVGSTADSVSGSVSSAAQTVAHRAEGNPLAAGLIAFGAGWLVSSLIPASRAEARAADRVVDVAKEHGQPVADEMKSAGQHIGADLKEHAAEAASELKESAQESVQRVADEGQGAAQTVKRDRQEL